METGLDILIVQLDEWILEMFATGRENIEIKSSARHAVIVVW